jgi:hypothetical protein
MIIESVILSSGSVTDDLQKNYLVFLLRAITGD